ncbi:MAG: ABC transporter substrate-binding protein, partial [Candidatus Peribacteraceae bacterium]|nr:ABC transporter substrate-binding protein [Candidatus Peribacteraceae bacterium]
MRRLLQLLSAMTRWERWILSLLVLLLLASGFGLVRLFYLRNSVLVPADGGTYIEGTVGELLPLNPWFIVRNDVNRDIVSLVFSGLLRYNPLSRKIEDDLATVKISSDAKVYTVQLKENLFWHDSTKAAPHPVTADDVLFTFKTIQDPQFPNALQRQNFRGVRIDKVDERTVRFTLEQPYSFFQSNLTLGLLPKASFEGIAIARLDQTVDFGFAPVGAGPYKIKSIVRTDLSTEVTLERFEERTLEPLYRLDGIVFRIFSDYSSLLSDLSHLDGVRLVPRNDDGQPIIGKHFEALQYTLPQYVALYFNLDRPALQDGKLRVGLQQGTNKQAIIDALHESVIVDTPLLELDTGDWHYQFNSDAAQGALLASRWNLPERVRLRRLLERDDANAAGLVHPAPVALFQEGG